MSIAERDRPHAALSSSGNGAGGGSGISSSCPSSAHGGAGNGGAELCPYPADPTFDELGHKVLLYLTRCFRGRVLGSSEPLSDRETAKVGRDGGVLAAPREEGGGEHSCGTPTNARSLVEKSRQSYHSVTGVVQLL